MEQNKLGEKFINYVEKYFSKNDIKVLRTKIEYFFNNNDYKFLFFQISQENNKPRLEFSFRYFKVLIDYTFVDSKEIITSVLLSKLTHILKTDSSLVMFIDKTPVLRYEASSENVIPLIEEFHKKVQDILQEF